MIELSRPFKLARYLLAALLCGCGQGISAGAPKLPNIALIVVDDMLYNTPESFGGSVPGLTPHIDALAARGMSFNQAYNASSRCAPSRGSMMTGFFQDGYSVAQVSSDTTVKDSVYTLPELLGKNVMSPGFLEKIPTIVL